MAPRGYEIIKNMLEVTPIKEVLEKDERVIFAYLFGSATKEEKFNDIDIGIYCTEEALRNPFALTSDIKFCLYKATSITADRFDITVINFLFSSDTAHSLFVLGEIFDGILLIDKNPDLRTDLIERVSHMFLEAEGLLMEVFS